MTARPTGRKLLTALLIGALASLAAALLPLRRFELKARDLEMQKTLPDRMGHPDIVLVVLTDECLEKVEREMKVSWPWDRELFGHLFLACARGGAKEILFDFFTHVDRGEGEPEWIEAMKKSPPAWLAAPFIREERAAPDLRPDREALLSRYALEVETDGSVTFPEEYRKVLLPRHDIAEAAAGICDVSTPRDEDGVLRRYRLLSKFEGRYYPSFALAALINREGSRRILIRDRILTVGKLAIPVDGEGKVHLRFYPPENSFRALKAHSIMGIKPSGMEGKTVIMGPVAAALYDRTPTPVSEVAPGMGHHAVALTNILRGEFLREAPPRLRLGLLILLALVTAMSTRGFPAIPGAAIAAGLFAGYTALSMALFKARWIVDLVAPLTALVFAYAGASAVNFMSEGRHRLRIKREFQRYLSPQVVEKILKNPGALSVAGERKTLTVFFMDFAGFTSLSETLDSTALVKLINEYHGEVIDEVFKAEGTFDKYIGDAIMAFWNDPVEQPDHALRACRTAILAQKRLHELAARMAERGLPSIRARIGINTGVATVGDMGAHGHVNYTVIGDEVNLASRLEGANKEFGTEIMISEATYLPAREHLEVRELALLKVKGKAQAVRIYELLGLKGEVSAERMAEARTFESGLAAYRARQWDDARRLFVANDRAAQLYRGLCDRYTAAPPEGWDGSYQLETK